MDKFKEIRPIVLGIATNNHKVTFVNYIRAKKVYEDLFKKLGDNNE